MRVSILGLTRVIGGVLLVFLACLIAFDAAMRAVGLPIVGTQDISSLALLLILTAGLADAWVAKANVSMDLIYSRFPRVVRVNVDILSLVLASIFCGTLIYISYLNIWHFMAMGARTPLIAIPHWLFAGAIMLGATCLACVIVRDAYRFVIVWKNRLGHSVVSGVE